MSSSTHTRLCGLTLAVVAAGLGSCSREPEEQPNSTPEFTFNIFQIYYARLLDTGVRPLWDAVQAVLKERGYALAVRRGLMLDDQGRVTGSVRLDEETGKALTEKELRARLGDSIPGRVIATHPDGTQLDVEFKPQDAGKTHLQFKLESLPGSKPIDPDSVQAIKWFIPAVLQRLGDEPTDGK